MATRVSYPMKLKMNVEGQELAQIAARDKNID
ncbi:hypothetical protein DET54_11339 [Paenibacillus pabuli]|uniref:Uncharacterized protein n=1 Tax=Paenibacillus pabuli TaxID=1472 RepID=A0A855XTN0_9BACL|nr:hypothetical protein DET56_107329 [Paenibacillus pabuli]PXW06112.1 hypothetical protein DEU73_107329 [Paenibacillus taichungensis]RAI89756.1 hypothetical protein DET54_11339 [Paenibacillus pabuli]